MTPNEICREIATRLQLDGGVCADQNYAGEWEVRARVNSPMNPVWDFADLNHVAKVIRAVGDEMGFSIQHGSWNGGDCQGRVRKGVEYEPHLEYGANEAEALTRALHAYLRANKIGEEHLQPPEPEEPWIDVSESVSTANLPEHGRECELEFDDSVKTGRWPWKGGVSAWDSPRGYVKPKALGGSVVKWRYAK